MNTNVHVERRAGRRYNLRLPVHYRIAHRGGLAQSGSGMTCDISTSGLSFRCRRPLALGTHIEMLIGWPAKFADNCPIDLQITGFVVRSDGNRTAVRVTSHKFRMEQAVETQYQASA